MNFCRFFSLLQPRPFNFVGFAAVFVIGLTVAPGISVGAQGTRLWTQSRFEEFEKGTPQGVAIGSDGKLRAGPTAVEVLTTPSSFVWSVAADNEGGVFVATGSPATVLKVDMDQSANLRYTKLFETKAIEVSALRVGPDGMLYAATIPDGRVYRLKPKAASPVDETTAEVALDLGKLDLGKLDLKSGESDGKSASEEKKVDGKGDNKSRYIWDLTFDKAGRMYVATGGPGAVYRVDVSKAQPTAEVFFKTDEPHLRSLAWDGAGNLIAGSDGSGLVYRIGQGPNGLGKGYVLFSAPRREITSVAVGADGTIYVSDVGDKAKNPLPQLPIASGGVGITISFAQPASMQAANASTALPEGSEIYALRPDQAARRLWADKDAIVYQIAAATDGLTVLTGNRGRIFTLHADGSFSDIAHLDAQQAVSMTTLPGSPGGRLVGTANTGKLYALSASARDETAWKATLASEGRRFVEFAHSYASDVLDAGALARWGRIEVDPGSKGYEIWTRSGNVEQPARNDKDWGWSDWQVAAEDKIVSPPGRYLQWKTTLRGDAELSGVGVHYLPVNSAPVVDEMLVAPGARYTAQTQSAGTPTVTLAFSSANAGSTFDSGAASQPIQAQRDRTAVTIRWAAHDDDGDDLVYDLYLRGDGEQVWRLLKKGVTEKVYSFDGALFPDDGYQVKVVASDAPSHAPGGALTGEMASERFELDTTPPVLADLKAGSPKSLDQGRDCRLPECAPSLAISVSFEARDAFSSLAHAEYSLDAGPWQYIEPIGGLSDAKTERYSFSVTLPPGSAEAEHLVTVRAYDRHDNFATAKTIVPARQAQ